MNKENRYWFPAKRYGWGWGLPISWQGWAVLSLWLAAILIATPLLRRTHPVAHWIFLGAMVVFLILICYMKGEPPAWRWGDRK
jgi:uncharacterized membrane protein YhaH (DUF805 family)